MRDQKPYCKEGESESYIALGWAVIVCFLTLLAAFLFFCGIGVINP